MQRHREDTVTIVVHGIPKRPEITQPAVFALC